MSSREGALSGIQQNPSVCSCSPALSCCRLLLTGRKPFLQGFRATLELFSSPENNLGCSYLQSVQLVLPVLCGTHLRQPSSTSQRSSQILGRSWCHKYLNETKSQNKSILNPFSVGFHVCCPLLFFLNVPESVKSDAAQQSSQVFL